MENTNNPILIGDRVQYDNSIGCTTIGTVVKIDKKGAWIQPENYGDDPEYLKDGLLGVGKYYTLNPKCSHYSESVVQKIRPLRPVSTNTVLDDLDQFINKLDTPPGLEHVSYDAGIRVGAKWLAESVAKMLLPSN
jgi:hypothetical protein